ncbi:MAG: hypothetical protein Fur009_1260 [Candidatus Microgenomates bacterium]
MAPIDKATFGFEEFAKIVDGIPDNNVFPSDDDIFDEGKKILFGFLIKPIFINGSDASKYSLGRQGIEIEYSVKLSIVS